jgi:hypothetical protein
LRFVPRCVADGLKIVSGKQAGSQSPGCSEGFNKARTEAAVSDSHVVNARSAAVEARQVAFASVPPIVPPNQAGQAIDQPHDGLAMIRHDCPICCGDRRASGTYSTLISNKDA